MISTTFAVVKYQRPKWSPWWDILRKIKNIYQGAPLRAIMMILTLELSQLHITNTENIKCTLNVQSGVISEKSYSTLIYGSFGVRMVLEGPIGSVR